MIINSAIIRGTNILKKKYINSARLDTEILMAEAINEDRKYVILNSCKKLKKENLRSVSYTHLTLPTKRIV